MGKVKWTPAMQEYVTNNMHKTVKALAVELKIGEETVRKRFHKIKAMQKTKRTTVPAVYSNRGYLSIMKSLEDEY